MVCALELFSYTFLPRSFVLVRCLQEANVAIFFFAGGLVGVNKHLFQMVSLVTSMTPPLRQCRCYSKTKKTKYCLKHEGKSHPCHPWQNQKTADGFS